MSKLEEMLAQQLNKLCTHICALDAGFILKVQHVKTERDIWLLTFSSIEKKVMFQ
jgi:hypothetical protein